uniref:alpha-amylase family glycosyl hydrolase n=1 Tax=Waltera intestinalis TaxID=2606635 RepID=UPI003FEFF71B
MMGKLLRSFQKRQSIASRIRCFLLALAMVVTMVPAFGGGSRTVQAAQEEQNLTIHFMMPSNWGWKTPAVQFWGGTYAVSGNTVSGNANTENADGTEIPGWDGAKGFFMSQGKSVGSNTTEYTLSVKGTFTGFQFLDFGNTKNTVNPAYDRKLSQYTAATPTDVYYIQKDGTWAYYLDADGTKVVPALQTPEYIRTIRIYFEKPDGWTTPVINSWGENIKITNGDIGNATVGGWGNQEIPKLAYDENSKLYYVDLQCNFINGFQFVNAEDSTEYQFANDDVTAAINAIKTDTSIYYLSDGNGGMKWYKDANKSETMIEYKEAGYKSPEVVGRNVTFRVPAAKAGNAEVVTVPGGMNGWKQDSSDWELKKDETAGMWSGTFTIAPGKYEYKFALNKTWDVSFSDPANNRVSGTNSVLIVPGLVDGEANATKANETALPEILTLWNEDGTSSETAVTYSLKTPDQNITLNGNKIKIGNGYTGQNVELTAEAENGQTSDFVVHVKEKNYTYTIYYYDFDKTHMSKDASDLWIWEKNGAVATKGTSFAKTETLSDGNEWLRAEVTLPYKDLQIIPRSKGEWKWQKDTISYSNSAGTENVTLYIVSNSKQAYTEIPELVAPRSRYVMIEYDRPAKDYTGWNIYTWNSGFGSDVSVNFADINGKMVAKIPVKDSTADLSLSFCMRQRIADDEWANKDGGDHYVTIPADQSVVKAVFTQGEGITRVLPYNTGFERDGANNAIHFYYRNDELAAENNLASFAGKVSIVINGQNYAMTYDADTDRFVYNLTDVSTGDYYYYYVVNGKEELDAFNKVTEKDNSGKECNVCHFKKANVALEASLSQSVMDYNDNNVLSVKINAKDGEGLEASEIAAITADLSELGLSRGFAIDPTLMEGTISCLNTVAAGEKTIPVTVKDIYGNVYTTDTKVNVTERVKKAGDFDWDEAVIYFTVTDRFFDGDAGNNDAYGVGDYNTGKKGGSSYHGGDFAGLNQKLDYLKDLGVNTIWITPIVENITKDQHDNETDTATYGYHGYWASDFTKLNKHLGTEEQFKALLEAAHSKGMKIMVDVVLNHAGYETEGYFNNILRDADGKPISMIRDDSNTIGGDDKYDSLSDLPDFVTENKAVTDQLVAWQTGWMSNYSIDYYRVDTVKHVETTTWAAFKNSLTKVNPDFKMIGEYSGAGYANNAGELGTGTMDALLDFDFNDFAQKFVTGNISSVENSLQKRNSAINNTATMGSFLSSHDEDTLQYKLVSESKISEEEAYNLMKVAATLQITAKGQPVIYYGEEIGQGGANNWPLQTNRRDFDWTELEKQKADSSSIYNHYKTMIAIRNAYTDVFARGNRSTVAASDAEGYEVISRSYGTDTLYVGMNVKETAKEVVIPVIAKAGTILTNLYDGKNYTVSADQKVSVTIPAAKEGGTIVLTEQKNTVDSKPENNNSNDNGSDSAGTSS